jgi:hypothetical protein
LWVAYYGATKNYLGYGAVHVAGNEFSVPDNCWFIAFALNGTFYNNDISINYPSTFTEYEPYQGQSVTVQLGQTVYGGTLDVDAGTLVMDRAIVDLGTLTWDKGGSYNNLFYANLSSFPYAVKVTNYDNTPATNIKCSNYDILAYTGINVDDTTTTGASIRRSDNTLRIKDHAYASSDAASFKTAMSGVQLVYELATPQTVQLTARQLALLEGYNILTTNGDTIDLRYIGTEASNVQAEIGEFEESTRKLAGSLAMVETSPATANHAVGDLIVFNNQLYKVTVAIASGEAIVVGTNVQSTTIADELKAILAQLSA